MLRKIRRVIAELSNVNPAESMNASGSCLSEHGVKGTDMQSNSHSTHVTEKELLAVTQNGWYIECNPQVNPNYDSVLVATIGKSVVAISAKKLADQSDGSVDFVQAAFGLSLDPALICNNIDKYLNVTLFNHSERLLGTLSCKQLLLSMIEEPLKVEEIAPSYGFFGGGRQEALNIVIDEAISQITLLIDANDTYLNLREINLYDQHNTLIPIDNNASVTYCSSKATPEQSLNVFHGHGFHSELEDQPWLKIGFRIPQYVKRLEIGNRNDAFGYRSQRLKVSVLNRQREAREVYSAYSTDGLANFYSKLFQKCGIKALEDCHNKDRWKKMLSYVCEYLSHNLEALQTSDLEFALQFLSSWSQVKNIDESEQQMQLRILAIYVLYSTRKKLNFTLLPFSIMLSRAEDLDFLEEQVNTLRSAEKLPEIQLTKHGVAYKGILAQNVSKVLESMQIVIEDLQKLGLRPCIAYGTLLGARREKSFIPHDDDVDLLVEFDQPNLTKERAFILTEGLLQKLDPTKYQTNLETRNENNLNIHILIKQTNMVIDIFPYWNDNGKSFLHMEKMKIRGINSEILRERTEIELYNYKFPAPGNTDEFLFERYGAGWTISDRYHEWPWALTKSKVLNS